MSGAVSVGIAAVAIGTAVATEFSTFAVIAAVGATVGAIGTVAKVPALQYAGAAIGVVGAVGGIASAAGAFGAGGVFGTGGTVGAISGPASSVGSAGAAGLPELGLANATGVDNLAGLGANASSADSAWAMAQNGAAVQWGGAGGFIDQANGMTTAAAATSPATAEAPSISAAFDGAEPGGNVNGQAGEQLAQAAQTNDILKGGTGAPPAPTTGPLVDAGATPPVTGTTGTDYINAPNSGDITKVGATDPNSSVWGGIKDFLKDNKTLVSGAVQAIGSFGSGLLNPLTPSQINALDAQAKANQAAARRSDAEAAILNMRASNMGQPIPVASRVTGSPALGIVNTAAPITGVPA